MRAYYVLHLLQATYEDHEPIYYTIAHSHCGWCNLLPLPPSLRPSFPLPSIAWKAMPPRTREQRVCWSRNVQSVLRNTPILSIYGVEPWQFIIIVVVDRALCVQALWKLVGWLSFFPPPPLPPMCACQDCHGWLLKISWKIIKNKIKTTTTLTTTTTITTPFALLLWSLYTFCLLHWSIGHSAFCAAVGR